MTDPKDASLEMDTDTQAILARRKTWMTRALAAMGTVVIGGTLANCFPCLTPLPPADSGRTDTPEGGAEASTEDVVQADE